jgi:ACR3 family arsenite efflux pump ArsB
MSIGGRDFLGPLRAVAMIAVVVGAGGSVGMTLHVGRHNTSRLLLALFVIWVLSPSVALAFASVVSKRWSAVARTTIHIVMLVLTLGSLAIYADVAFGPPRAKPAFAFLVVPLASWLLIAIARPVAAFLFRRLSRQGDCA